MTANIRRTALGSIVLAIVAGVLMLLNPSSAFAAGTGNGNITGGLDHPYLPDAAAYQSDTTTGCNLGYYYGDHSQDLAPGSAVTCFPFASDFDQTVAVYYSTTTITCNTGYQRELAGDGYTTPHFIRCWPFASWGDLAVQNGYSSTKSDGCAPGFTEMDFSTDPSDQGAACFVTSHSDAPAPQGCPMTTDANNNLLPCVDNGDGTSGIQYPPTPPLVPVAGVGVSGDASAEGTLVASIGTFPSGTSVHFQWRVDGRNIGGATSSRFLVPGTYNGHYVSVAVSASHAGYLPWSGVSRNVKAGPARLLNTHSVYFTGTSMHGGRLYARVGYFYKAYTHYQRVNYVHYSYQWYVDGRGIRGATGSSYVLPRGWKGHIITVRVSGSKAGFYGWSSSSGRLRIR